MVFTNELDRTAHPLASRTRGIVIGTLVMGFIGAALVSPRTIPFGLPILAVCAAAIGTGRKAWDHRHLRSTYGLIGIIGFLLLAFSSVLWAEQSDAPLGPALKGVGYLLAAVAICEAIRMERRSNALHIAEGMWIGLLASLLYLLFEILTGQIVKLHLYRALGLTMVDLRPSRYFTWAGNHLVAISPFDLTRNIAPVSMFLWAALQAINSGVTGNLRRILIVALFVLAAVVIALSEHETSKFGIIASTLVFLVARAAPEWSLAALRVVWVTACLAIIPVSLALHRAELHQSHWLQATARHRIIIWNHTAEEALKAPILGFGAGMMYRVGSDAPQKNAGEEFQYNVPHAHNVYLQTWFELGAVGAALLTLIGLAMLERISRLSRSVAPFAQATFASAMVMAAASYGMWQPWFIAMFASTVVAFAIAMRVASRSEIADPAPNSGGAAAR